MDKKFVIGDIHGAYRALMQCFEKAGFDYSSDYLICLGDICDGWPDVCRSISELLKIKNLVYILGNHDEWALKWFLSGDAPDVWVTQGGKATINSYTGKIPASHIRLLQSAKLYHIIDNKLFVHAGFDRSRDISLQDKKCLIWDRQLVYDAFDADKENVKKITQYNEVYVGHTPTLNFGSVSPVKVCEIYLMDTGAGWRGGVLSMMDIDTKELFTSNKVNELYPGYKGRG